MTSTQIMPNNLNLRRLTAIRALVLGGQIASRYAAESQLGWMMPYVTLDLLFTALVTFALFSWWRSYRPWPVTDPELFVHFLIDVIGFSAVLYFSGGASNPFISYLLVPLCLTAASLPWLYTWLLGGLCVGAYTLLGVYFVPLAAFSPQHMSHDGTNWHLWGMWVNFVVSASLISYFVVKMASQLRQREKELASVRERQLQNDQLLAVAALAAGTAHELGTPLSTIQIIGEDLYEELPEPGMREDIATLNSQIGQCRHILEKLVNTARELSNVESQTWALNDYLSGIRDRWQVIRPDCSLICTINDNIEALKISLDGTVSQAILNLLNNAADASPDDVELEVSVAQEKLIFAVLDRGPGIPKAGPDNMRKAFISTKGKGMGLGLFLSHATAERYNGSLNWLPRNGGGSRIELALPLNELNGDNHD